MDAKGIGFTYASLFLHLVEKLFSFQEVLTSPLFSHRRMLIKQRFQKNVDVFFPYIGACVFTSTPRNAAYTSAYQTLFIGVACKRHLVNNAEAYMCL